MTNRHRRTKNNTFMIGARKYLTARELVTDVHAVRDMMFTRLFVDMVGRCCHGRRFRSKIRARSIFQAACCLIGISSWPSDDTLGRTSGDMHNSSDMPHFRDHAQEADVLGWRGRCLLFACWRAVRRQNFRLRADMSSIALHAATHNAASLQQRRGGDNRDLIDDSLPGCSSRDMLAARSRLFDSC